MEKSLPIVSIEEVYRLLRDGDDIVVGMIGAEPQLFLSRLHTVFPRVKNLRLTNCLPMYPAPFFTQKEYAPFIQVDSWFFSPALRKAYDHGNISFVPNHLHLAAVRRLAHRKPRIYIGASTYPNAEGKISLSVSNVYEKRMIEAADIVILEINPQFPRTHGDLIIDVQEVDYMVEATYPVPELQDQPLEDKDIQIGKLIAERIPDGACLQLGIGGIPNAVAAALTNKKDLGVHTEMLTTGFLKLYQSGAITNQKKQTHPGKFVCCFVAGTRALYDFVNDNPNVLVMDGHYVNNPDVIKLNDNQISINSTIEVDLTGQCCSESIGSRHFSGTGGQSDTATGAVKSKGGQSFIALYSTAMVMNPASGKKEEVSKIVAQLKPGAIVSLSRNDVDHVVTEYGVAYLRGTNVKERVERLIAIAHPKFRDQLAQDAKQIGLI
jgi:acyl-CoA hydrolase